MAAVMEQDEAIFANAEQAVHVAFTIMAQEATQDAPLRKALIRVMESIRLTNGQRNWLDELRGAAGGTVNFGGLAGNEIRAQCAMITEAVAMRLPKPEMWVLQAKYGQTDFEDVHDDDAAAATAALEQARENVTGWRVALAQALAELEDAKAARSSSSQVGGDAARFHDAREQVEDLRASVEIAERGERVAQIAVDRLAACRLVDNGRQPEGRTRRRFVFSAERIAAIRGLAEWFAPSFPKLNRNAIDCLLGRLFAPNHKKLDISVRDLAGAFGGSRQTYQRASTKMKAGINDLERIALARLEPMFRKHGVIDPD